ncbi:MAG: RluA family pseudouridine synthase [Clostridia bacterium]|nr:RluA family pseudouridine synthase [Clostridia bacterium]
MKLSYTVETPDSGKTIKHILKNKLELSERLVKKLKYAGKILCNSVPVFVNAIVKTDDIIEVMIDFVEEAEDIIPEKIDVDIIYEDEAMIIINKAPSIVVHPTSSHPSGTIANGIMYYLLNKGVVKKIRPVSRLDRDTTGLIIFAKNQFVQESLIRQMTDKTFKKEYIGVVDGIVENKTGTINLPIDRKPGSIMLRHISESGYASVTHYEVKEYLNNATFLKFNLETGRTHQIRVHCQAIGHPLVGDTLYSDRNTELISRQALHSYKVSFTHPFSKDSLEFYAPIPHDISSLLEILRK